MIECIKTKGGPVKIFKSGDAAGRPAVPQTISDKKWGQLRDSLPFPVDPSNLTGRDDTRRRLNFGHQRMRSDQS
jgi:hypothetical protein